jgi:hypothetical protein
MPQYTAVTSSDVATNDSLIASDRVEGTKVLDRSGKDIGTIKRLKIDVGTGRRSDMDATDSTPDTDLDDNDKTWDRSPDREVYDYFAVRYYWDE